jgi:NADH dehydrogenase
VATSPHVESSPEDLVTWPHVVVVGGGFAGLSTVRKLANKPVRVTIVNKHNFHTFLPLLYQVATAGLEPADVAYPIRTVFGRATNISVRHASVTAVDQARNVVVLDSGVEIRYDHMVVATGATASFFNIPGAAKYAMPLYTLSNARRLRNRLLRAPEDAEVAAEFAPVALNFVVVGGGPTGVETAGALSELIDIVIKRDGLQLGPSKMRIRLVDVTPWLLTAFPDTASSYAKKELEKMDVEVELGRSVVEVKDHSIVFSDGENLDTAAVIWAAGVTASGTLADALDGPKGPSGRVLVGPDLRLVNSENVWCVGDAAAIPGVKDGFYPQLAPVAIQSGCHCATQILRALAAEKTQPFHLPRQGHHGHDWSSRGGGETAPRGRDPRHGGLVRLVGAAPVLPRGF